VNYKSDKLEMPIEVVTVINVIIGAILGISLEFLLKDYLVHILDGIDRKYLMIIICFLFIGEVALEFSRHRQIPIGMSRRNARILALLILLAIPLIWFLWWYKDLLISSFMVLMAMTALFSNTVRTGFWKSFFIAAPAITLGVVIGSSGAIFVENTLDYGNPIADTNVVIVDHRLAQSDLSGNYPLKAAEYVVVRDDKEIKVGVSGVQMEKVYHVPKDIVITFNGQPILPDGKKMDFSLERGKNYMLILED
jgi:hypothetical protein